MKYNIDLGEDNPPVDASETIHQNAILSEVVMKHCSVFGFSACWENKRYLYI